MSACIYLLSYLASTDECYFPPGERLTDIEVDEVIKFTDLQEDLEGNVKYEGE